MRRGQVHSETPEGALSKRELMAAANSLIRNSGFAIAATERVLERDNKGPRVGFGTKADVIRK